MQKNVDKIDIINDFSKGLKSYLSDNIGEVADTLRIKYKDINFHYSRGGSINSLELKDFINGINYGLDLYNNSVYSLDFAFLNFSVEVTSPAAVINIDLDFNLPLLQLIDTPELSGAALAREISCVVKTEFFDLKKKPTALVQHYAYKDNPVNSDAATEEIEEELDDEYEEWDDSEDEIVEAGDKVLTTEVVEEVVEDIEEENVVEVEEEEAIENEDNDDEYEFIDDDEEIEELTEDTIEEETVSEYVDKEYRDKRQELIKMMINRATNLDSSYKNALESRGQSYFSPQACMNKYQLQVNLNPQRVLNTEDVMYNELEDYPISEERLKAALVVGEQAFELTNNEIFIQNVIDAYLLESMSIINKERDSLNNLSALNIEASEEEPLNMADVWEFLYDGIMPILSSALDSGGDEDLHERLLVDATSILKGPNSSFEIVPVVANLLYRYYFEPNFINDEEFDTKDFPEIVLNFFDYVHVAAAKKENFIAENYGDAFKSISQKIRDEYLSEIVEYSYFLPTGPRNFADKITEIVTTDLQEDLQDPEQAELINADRLKYIVEKIIGDRFDVDRYISYFQELWPHVVRKFVSRSFGEGSNNEDFKLFQYLMFYVLAEDNDEVEVLKRKCSGEDSQEGDNEIMRDIAKRQLSKLVFYFAQAVETRLFRTFDRTQKEELNEETVRKCIAWACSAYLTTIAPYVKDTRDLREYLELTNNLGAREGSSKYFPDNRNTFYLLTQVTNNNKIPLSFYSNFMMCREFVDNELTQDIY